MKALASFLFRSPFTAVLVLLTGWQALAQSGLVNPMLLPSASAVLGTIPGLLTQHAVWVALGITLFEALVSFVIGVVLGGLIGVYLGSDPFRGAVGKPFFYILFSVPKSVFLPLFILVIGIGMPQKIAYGVFSTLFIVVINIAVAVESVERSYVTTARSFGANARDMVTRVYLPSMLPAILETLRLGMIFNLTGVLLAEIYVSRTGVGHLLGNWGLTYQLKELMAGIIIIAIIAILINEGLRWLEVHYGSWRTEHG